MDTPKTNYAVSDGVHIAWQVFGDGPVDLVFVPGWFSNVEVTWDYALHRQFFTRLAAFSRVILFDKRGTGLSDRETTAFTLEDRMDDVRTVMDAAGSKRAVLVGLSEGGPMCALFAATYPQRTDALIMIGSYARRNSSPDYPHGQSSQDYEKFIEAMEQDWVAAIEAAISARAPSLGGDEEFVRYFSRYLRLGASPSTGVKFTRMNGEIDIRHVLPSIHVPTLIVHATGDRVCSLSSGRYLAENIPGARLCEIESEDHLCHLTHTEEVVSEIEELVTGQRSAPIEDSVVTTILFTDIVGSTDLASQLGDQQWAALLVEHHQLVREKITQLRGVEVKSTGDGLHATFDGPARAIRCGLAIQQGVASLGIDLRVGLHTGECVITANGLEGIAVHIAARVAQNAPAGCVLVSQTVRDLVAGSGLCFESRGEHALRGVPDMWRLYAALP